MDSATHIIEDFAEMTRIDRDFMFGLRLLHGKENDERCLTRPEFTLSEFYRLPVGGSESGAWETVFGPVLS
ncbi:uncharacterized protein CLUP02_14833 [Colletotrichum lupini]|uniref:Uncharacterized protein n=1 Tax=Colletotrichum lupini TaxID=145971 RepID=A0A9Q8WMZ2_9PEZI|nr:uncharacterized protein CLUP02_14833 [Colletotrichum lupini]UQC89304.1 hypothetical protein CLUP02_14833 [Colletotrichum lupini]